MADERASSPTSRLRHDVLSRIGRPPSCERCIHVELHENGMRCQLVGEELLWDVAEDCETYEVDRGRE